MIYQLPPSKSKKLIILKVIKKLPYSNSRINNNGFAFPIGNLVCCDESVKIDRVKEREAKEREANESNNVVNIVPEFAVINNVWWIYCFSDKHGIEYRGSFAPYSFFYKNQKK